MTNELRRWKDIWIENLSISTGSVKRCAAKVCKRADGESSYAITDPPDSLLEALQCANEDFFPNICPLFIIACLSPIGSAEAEEHPLYSQAKDCFSEYYVGETAGEHPNAKADRN